MFSQSAESSVHWAVNWNIVRWRVRLVSLRITLQCDLQCNLQCWSHPGSVAITASDVPHPCPNGWGSSCCRFFFQFLHHFSLHSSENVAGDENVVKNINIVLSMDHWANTLTHTALHFFSFQTKRVERMHNILKRVRIILTYYNEKDEHKNLIIPWHQARRYTFKLIEKLLQSFLRHHKLTMKESLMILILKKFIYFQMTEMKRTQHPLCKDTFSWGASLITAM